MLEIMPINLKTLIWILSPNLSKKMMSRFLHGNQHRKLIFLIAALIITFMKEQHQVVAVDLILAAIVTTAVKAVTNVANVSVVAAFIVLLSNNPTIAPILSERRIPSKSANNYLI